MCPMFIKVTEKPKEPIPPEPSVCNLVQQPQIAASPKGKKDKEKEKEKEKEKSPKAPLSPEHTAVVKTVILSEINLHDTGCPKVGFEGSIFLAKV